MDIFNDDIKVSIYNGKYDNVGVVLPLRTFLNSTRHKEQILQARKIADKKQRDAIKVTMPMAIVGGVCQGSRKAKNTIPNGLIAVDMDAKDNPGVTDWEALKFDLGKFAPQIAYCSLSFSGNGLFAIIPIKYPRHFTQHFEQLLIDFSNVGIVLDKSCRDISRTRFLSYDEHPYINHNAVPYERLHIEPKKPVPLTPVGHDASETEIKVAECVRQIKSTGTNLTVSYDDWIKIGMSLADLGEAGRQYYHAVSSMDGRYNRTQTDKKFNNFLQKGRSIHIGTFFKKCEDAGIRCSYQTKPKNPHRIEPQQPIAPKVEQLPTQAEKVPVIEEKRAKEQPYHIPDEPHLQQMIANNPAIGNLCTKLQLEVVRVDEHPRQYPHIHFDPMEGIEDEPVDLSAEWERVMSQPIPKECPF